MAKRAKPKADNRADTRGGGWVGIPHTVVDSAAYRDLSLWARAVLIEITRTFNGYNNGSIAISQRQIASALSTTNFRKIGNAVGELMDHGLVDVTAEGRWKAREARQYRLTFVSSGGGPTSPRLATNDYLKWTKPEKSGADDVSAERPVLADDVSAASRKSADDVSARIAASRRKTAISENAAADDVSSLIGKPYQGRSPDGDDATRQPKASASKPPLFGGPTIANHSGSKPAKLALARRMKRVS